MAGSCSATVFLSVSRAWSLKGEPSKVAAPITETTFGGVIGNGTRQHMKRLGVFSLFVPAGRAVDAAGAIRGRTAPNALVRAGAMTVLARGRMDATRPVGRRTAPLAVLLVVTMLVLLRRAVDATRTITRRTAMPAFRAHVIFLSQNRSERTSTPSSLNSIPKD